MVGGGGGRSITRLFLELFLSDSVLPEAFARKHEEFWASETLSLLILQKPFRAQHFLGKRYGILTDF